MFVIGLTGRMGSGKSTVAAMLGQKGARIIDTAKLGHDTYRPSSDGWREIVAAFGEGVVGTDSEIDRRRLAAIAFGSGEALQKLNAITHPRIRALLAQQLDELRQAATAVAIVDSALLIEAGWLELVDEVWLVEATDELATERLIAGRGLSRQQVEARLLSQLSSEARRKRADVVIDNSGSMDELGQRVEQAWQQLERKLSSSQKPTKALQRA